MFGVLTIFSHSVPNQTISIGGSGGKQDGEPMARQSKSNVGAIVGGVVGGLAAVGLVIAIILILRKRRKQQYEASEKPEAVEQAPHHPTLSPYYQSPSSDYMPATAHSNTTAGLAGIGAGETGAQQGPSANTQYSSSTNMAHVLDMLSESTAVSPSPSPSPMTPPSKAREVALNRAHYHAPSVAASSNTGSQTGTASSRDPLSPGSSGSNLLSPTEVLGLREEVDNLRRVVQEIRAERFEPPPEYVEE